MTPSPDLSSPTLVAARERLVTRFGPRVEPWWSALPALVAGLAEGWELDVGDPIGRGNTSLVVRCRCPAGAAVLKLTPDAELAAAEAWALRGWAATGHVPAVWGVAPGALLLEAIPNELPLSELGTAVAVDEVASLIGALHSGGEPVLANGVDSLPARIEFIFGHWIERRAGDAVPVELLRRGRDLARELVADPEVPVLLHGDLHPGNVLDGGPERGLVAIDPRPCVGEAAADLVDWVFWAAGPDAWRPRSRELAAALGLDPERVWSWCRAFAAMLAASRAAHGEPDVAELLALAP